MGKNTAPKKEYGREIHQFHNGHELVFTKLDQLEEYENNVSELDEYAFAYLSNSPKYSSVYTVSGRDLDLYSDSRMDEFRVIPSIASVIAHLRYGFKMREIDPTTLPVIPIMEYKLVPTGNIYYFDPALPPEEESKKRHSWKVLRNYHLNKNKKKGKK